MRWTATSIAFVLLLLAAPPARADGYLSPGLGVAFGNPSAAGRANFVADLGWVPNREPLGAELDFTYAPDFFGNAGPYGQNSVTTVMANVIFAGGMNGYYGRRSQSIRPYVSGGLGLMNESLPNVSNSSLGANLGFGIMGVNRRRIGVRGDIRYYRDLVGSSEGNASSIDFGSFHFWRGSIGVVLGF